MGLYALDLTLESGNAKLSPKKPSGIAPPRQYMKESLFYFLDSSKSNPGITAYRLRGSAHQYA